MSCYLCAQKSPQKPNVSRSLPAGSPAGQNDDLGTCSICGVWACSVHGTRYSPFECAICTYASAAQQAVVAGSAGNAAAAVAYLAGAHATRALEDQVQAALEFVVADGRRQSAGPEDIRSLVAPGAGEPNLVTNLAEVIRRSGGPQAFVPAVRATRWEAGSMVDEAMLDEAEPAGSVPAGAVSIDAIAGSVREVFAASSEFMDLAPDAARIAAGSLLLAYSLADETVAARRGGQPPVDEPAYRPWVEDSLPAPWEVSHPVLLDPVIWMLGTACRLVSVGITEHRP